MSNYYYDEKTAYLQALTDSHADEHDLTPFLIFGLQGIKQQTLRLLSEIKTQVEKAIYRNLMFDLFNRLQSPKKRVIVKRQIAILKLLLDRGEMDFEDLVRTTEPIYRSLNSPRKAMVRDLSYLRTLGALSWRKEDRQGGETFVIFIRLQWPAEITETSFFSMVKHFPKGKTYAFLQ